MIKLTSAIILIVFLSPQPAKPFHLYKQWTDRILVEFYTQGDKERELGLPVGPLNDRENPIPEDKFQIGFISAIVLPLYTALQRVPGYVKNTLSFHAENI